MEEQYNFQKLITNSCYPMTPASENFPWGDIKIAEQIEKDGRRLGIALRQAVVEYLEVGGTFKEINKAFKAVEKDQQKFVEQLKIKTQEKMDSNELKQKAAETAAVVGEEMKNIAADIQTGAENAAGVLMESAGAALDKLKSIFSKDEPGTPSGDPDKQ